MKNRGIKTILVGLSLILITSCTIDQKNEILSSNSKGKLFIIGGGKRPVEMIQSMVHLSKTDSGGYIVVLPMASGYPDTAAYYSTKQFFEIGLTNVYALDFQSQKDMTKERLDSVRNARLIYISGGDQKRFMDIVNNTELFDAIHDAYRQGAVISGTSAGAAVMSKKMITGNEFKHPEYTGNFRTIESENIEIAEGIGLIENAIVDQHFVRRMRMNRLISACLENPEETCIGIDESTAIYVDGNKATVYGNSQVIVLKNKSAATISVGGLLAGEGLDLSIYLPGDTFAIK
jgi:cyanophycinase